MNMKKTRLMVAFAAVLLATAAHAQRHLEKAIDSFVKNKGVTVTDSHSLYRDSETGVRKGQCDTYIFSMPKSHRAPLDDLRRAFEQDRDVAYDVNIRKGNAEVTDGLKLQLACGNDQTVIIGMSPEVSYVSQCYADPEQKGYRTAYVVWWNDTGDRIFGNVIISYAKIPSPAKKKYRLNSLDFDSAEDIQPYLDAYRKHAQKKK